MSRRFQILFANATSSLITLALIVAVGAFIFLKREALTSFAPVNTNTLSEATKEMAKSERVDEKLVEKELNKIAEEKRKKEAQRIAEEKRKKAAVEKERKEKIAKEEAKKKEEMRIRLEKEAKIKKEKEEAEDKLRKENEVKAEKAREQQAIDQKKKEEEERKNKEAAETAEKARQAQIASANEAKIDAALSASYINQVHGYLYSMWQPTIVNEGLSTTVLISVNSDGQVQGTPKITKQSGNFSFDDSVIIAILSASPLPMPDEPLARARLARDGFEVTFTPKRASEESF